VCGDLFADGDEAQHLPSILVNVLFCKHFA
jgi:hypothetical protein